MIPFFQRLRKLKSALKYGISNNAFFRHRVLAGFEHHHVLTLEAYATIVDIGANRGQYSLAARALNPNANIFAFEPLEEPADIWDSVMSGDSKAKLFRVAIAPHSGHQKMHVTVKKDSSSLLPISDLQVSLFPESKEVGMASVTTSRLSELVGMDSICNPSLLKIDVQGYERDVLKGCKELLTYFDHIYVECSFVELYLGQACIKDIILELSKEHFTLNGVYNLLYDKGGKPIQGDFLFSKGKDL